MDVVDVLYDVGISGKEHLANREAGQRLLELIHRKQINAVVILNLNRLFRSTIEFLQTTAEWDRKGVALHIVNIAGQSLDASSAMGRFMMTMMAAVAELENDLSTEGIEPPRWEGSGHPREGNPTETHAGEQVAYEHWITGDEDIISEPQRQKSMGRPKRSSEFDGQRFTVRLSQDLSTRLLDRARRRAGMTHADSATGGHVSDIIREALIHFLSGCDREVQEPPTPAKASTAKATKPKATAPKRTRTPAKAARS